jgi:hypothetical protein
MHSAKFIEVLRTFSAQEFKTFGVFLNSPYFNTEKLPTKLYELLKKHYPEFTSKSLSKEIVFTKLYSGKPYNDKLMRNIASDMLKLAETFITAESSRKDELKSKILLMNEFSRRKLISMFERNAEKAESILSQTQTEDIDFYKNRLEIERSKKQHEIIHKDIYINPKNREQDVSDQVTAVSLLEMIYCNLKLTSIEKKFDFEYRLNFEDEVDQFLLGSGSRFLENVYIKCLYYNFKLLRTQQEKYYFLLRDITQSDFGRLPREIKRDTFIALANYCYIRISKGDDEYVREIFLNNREMIRNDLFTTAAGNIPNVFFMNVVTTGLECGEQEWVDRFITENGHRLKDDSREDTLNFCLANLSYFKGDYGSSFRLLAKIKTDDMTYKHNVRSLTLKLYFDTNEIEPFLSHIDSYRHFIAGNKLVFDKIKDSLNNYISFSKRIFSIKNRIGKYDEDDLPNLKREIMECTPLINRPWLLRKIAELEKKIAKTA